MASETMYDDWFGRDENWQKAMRDGADTWVPANGGMEDPFKCGDRTLILSYNPKTGKQAYKDVVTGEILSAAEVAALVK